jgi:DNA processing protein
MAKWVDQLAHDFSIENWIPTIAVLWGGIGNYYKSADKELIQKIVDSGWSVLSQFKHNFSPTNYSFPTRNQFIAAISDILIVPEAGKDSWSLITVDYMLQLNKKSILSALKFSFSLLLWNSWLCKFMKN